MYIYLCIYIYVYIYCIYIYIYIYVYIYIEIPKKLKICSSMKLFSHKSSHQVHLIHSHITHKYTPPPSDKPWHHREK